MATSTQSNVFSNLTYVDTLKDDIIASGGTIVFVRDNLILATEVSEAQYRSLLSNPYVQKIDTLPIKRYGNEGVKYQQSNFVLTNSGSTSNI